MAILRPVAVVGATAADQVKQTLPAPGDQDIGEAIAQPAPDIQRGAYVTDTFGNALGGVRSPAVYARSPP
jgi:hypothetical protein